MTESPAASHKLINRIVEICLAVLAIEESGRL